MTAFGRATHSQRGSTIAEFAFAATFALMLLFGILDFGRALYDYHLVANAARLGSRYAIVHGSDCTAGDCPATPESIASFVQSRNPDIPAAALGVSVAWPAAPAANCYTAPYKSAGCLVSVTATYTYQFLAFPAFANIVMTSTSQMPISQ